MAGADALEQGRRSYEELAWADAYARLSAADGHHPLGPEDLERLATAAYLLGRDDDGADAGARAHHEFLRRGEVERAVRCAFWLAFSFFQRGDQAREPATHHGGRSLSRSSLSDSVRDVQREQAQAIPEAEDDEGSDDRQADGAGRDRERLDEVERLATGEVDPPDHARNERVDQDDPADGDEERAYARESSSVTEQIHGAPPSDVRGFPVIEAYVTAAGLTRPG